MNQLHRLATALSLPLMLLCCAGCSTLAPKYNQPPAPVAAAWPETGGNKEVSIKPLADIPWQEFFTDPKLRSILTLALENNRDLKVATLTIERARARYQIQRSDLLPKIDATAGANFQRVAEDFSGKSGATTLHQYSVGLGVASYELDLFGRVQNLKEQALEQYLATEQGRKSVQITLVSQVAIGYLTLAADRERLALAKQTLVNQQEAYQLVQSRFEAGLATSLALSQARTTVDTARIDVARYTSLVMQDENALNLTVGSTVPANLLPDALSENLTALKDLSPGVPSDVLLRRPDILQAESQLKGFNANIGAARAAYFPRITLVSSIGFGSDELSGLFSAGSLAWTFAPRISIPIFNAGSNDANLKVAEVDRDIAIAQYEQAIRIAFREVADALAGRATIDEQLAAQQSLATATAESYTISQARFDKGVDNFLSVLDSQRSLYTAQQGVIAVRLARLANLVTLYKVLGGGGL